MGPEITAALALGGTVLSAVGAIGGANAEADIDEANARIAEADAQAEKEAAEARAREIAREKDIVNSRNLATAGASGFQVGVGSQLLVDFANNLEAQHAIDNELAASAVTQRRHLANAEIFRTRAKSTRRSGKFKAAGSLLKGASGFIPTSGGGGLGGGLGGGGLK